MGFKPKIPVLAKVAVAKKGKMQPRNVKISSYWVAGINHQSRIAENESPAFGFNMNKLQLATQVHRINKFQLM